MPLNPLSAECIVGEIDPSAYTGDIYYTRIRRQWYYDVVMTDVDVEGRSLGVEESCREFNKDKTIVDSGWQRFVFFLSFAWQFVVVTN